MASGSALRQVSDLLTGDFTASTWLKTALRSALQRDCVDAANDAEVLARILKAVADEAAGITPEMKGRGLK